MPPLFGETAKISPGKILLGLADGMAAFSEVRKILFVRSWLKMLEVWKHGQVHHSLQVITVATDVVYFTCEGDLEKFFWLVFCCWAAIICVIKFWSKPSGNLPEFPIGRLRVAGKLPACGEVLDVTGPAGARFTGAAVGEDVLGALLISTGDEPWGWAARTLGNRFLETCWLNGRKGIPVISGGFLWYGIPCICILIDSCPLCDDNLGSENPSCAACCLCDWCSAFRWFHKASMLSGGPGLVSI